MKEKEGQARHVSCESRSKMAEPCSLQMLESFSKVIWHPNQRLFTALSFGVARPLNTVVEELLTEEGSYR